MIRTQIYITEKEQEFLRKEAEEMGISMAEVIRRILDEHIKVVDPG
jgi:hypothetical protein